MLPKTPIALRFWLTLIIQCLLILAIPVQAMYTQMTGRSIALQTGSVDPYNPFQGYSLTLSYEISQPQTIEPLPGWETIELTQVGDRPRSWFEADPEFYLVLQAPANQTAQPPQLWQPIAVSRQYPSLGANQVALRGVYRQGQIRYGMETYYIPEAQRLAINEQITQMQSGSGDRVVMEVKVGQGGEAVPLRLWVGEQPYQF